MARAYVTGWESGSLSGEPRITSSGDSANVAATVGSAAIESTIVRSGAFSLKLTPASGANGYWDAQTGTTLGAVPFGRFYVRVTALPSLTRILYGTTVSGTTQISLNSDGTLSIADPGSGLVTSTTALTDTSRWYRVEWDGTGSARLLYIEGVLEATASGTALTAAAVRLGAPDTVAATYTAYIEDFVLDTTALPGAGNVILLPPVSDNARNAWTGGAGGTAGIFTGVDNTPPTGAADPGTDASQVRVATTTLPNNYDINIRSYSTAGIGASDTINSVMAWCVHGEGATATGTKAGSIEILSNPVLAATTWNYGGDVGVCAAFPSNWRINRTGFSAAPAVTRGTSPVVRVQATSGVTAARPADVCFVGVYVDYTIAATIAPPLRVKLQALIRASTW